jgi:hypothetical protein
MSAVARTMIGIEALAGLDDEAVVALYVPAVSAVLESDSSVP